MDCSSREHLCGINHPQRGYLTKTTRRSPWQQPPSERKEFNIRKLQYIIFLLPKHWNYASSGIWGCEVEAGWKMEWCNGKLNSTPHYAKCISRGRHRCVDVNLSALDATIPLWIIWQHNRKSKRSMLPGTGLSSSIHSDLGPVLLKLTRITLRNAEKKADGRKKKKWKCITSI